MSGVSAARTCALLLALLWASAGRAAAQSPARRLQPELRVDVLGPTPTAAQAGVGVVAALGYYVRLGVIGSAGAALDAPSGASARADVIARFLLDPFHQSRWGISAGGGLSVRHDPGMGTRPRLALVLDVEPPGRGRWGTALQVGLGGGVRAGVGVRRRVEGRR